MVEAAIREGAEFLRAEVTGFERRHGTISAVKTDRGRRGVSMVVVAAGARTKPLARQLGLDVPLERGSTPTDMPNGWVVVLPYPTAYP